MGEDKIGSGQGAIALRGAAAPFEMASGPAVIEVDLLAQAARTVQRLWWRRGLIVVVTTVATFGAVLLAMSQPHRFTSYGQMVIEPQALALSSTSNAGRGPLLADVQAMMLQNEIRKMLARDTLAAAAAETNLFARAADELGDDVPDATTNPNVRAQLAEKALLRRVTVTVAPQSQMIEVAATTRDPVLSAEIVNTLMAAYLRKRDEERLTAIDTVVAGLDAREARLAAELAEAGAALGALRASLGLRGAEDTGLLQEEAALRLRLLDARLAMEAARGDVEAVDRATTTGSWADEAYDTPLVQELIAADAAARARLKDAAIEGARSPAYLAARQEAAAAQAALDAAIAGLTRERRAALARASAAYAEIAAAHGAVNARLDAVLSADPALSQRARAVEERRARLAEVAQSRALLNDQRLLDAANARVVTPAAPALEPSGPNRKLIAVAGAMAGGFLAVLLALTLEMRRRPVRVADDVNDLLGAPPLALTPRVRGRRTPQSVVAQDPAHPFACAVRATALALAPPGWWRGDGLGRVVVVAGAGPGVGTSVIASTLAVTFHREGRRVALVTLNSPCAATAEVLKQCGAVRLAPGVWTDPAQSAPARRAIGAGDATAERALRDRDQPGLFTLSCADARVARPWPAARWMEMVHQLASAFDVVVIDGESARPGGETSFLAAAAAATLLVMRQGRTSTEEAAAALQTLRAAGAGRVGGVLNQR